MKTFQQKAEIMLLVLSTIILLVSTYHFMPVYNYGFIGLPILFLFISIILLVFRNKIKLSIIKSIGVLFLLVLIIPGYFSMKNFNSSKYRNLIGEVKTSDFNKDISLIDIKQVRIVDQELATKLGEKIIGKDVALGSIAELGTFNIQLVKGKLYWVAPLLHKSFVRWVQNMDGTPGYVMVSATNPSDIKFIQEIDGEPIKIKIQKKAYFGNYLYRKVYMSYMTSGITDFTFEIDDKGYPYYVVTKFDKKIGYFGSDATGVITLNAQTGEIKEYSIEEAPEWIDRIQPEEFMKTQVNDWGEFVDGWLNTKLSKENQLKLTKGMSIVYGKDGQSYWYSGLTSFGSDSSTVGFILINTRTKEIFRYNQAGATELKAMESAEGQVQEKKYKSTFPVLYNVLGTPTYIMSLKDKGGLIKQIAMVSVENYDIVGVGNNIKSALRDYKSKLSYSGKNMSLSDNIQFKELKKQIIDRIKSDVKNGNSFYYVKLENLNQVFIIDSSLNEDIILTEKGDIVNLKYEDSTQKYQNLIEFENLSY